MISSDYDPSSALAVLADLVAFDTTSRNSNLALIDYAEKLLADLGARCIRVPDVTGTKASLLASFGPLDRPGVILSGHTDVVPVDGQDWSSDPFMLSVRDGLAYGRGAADMKGFIACCLALAPELARAADKPVHIALSYDEELGCLGAPDLARTLLDHYGPQRLAIIGEPTLMAPVIGHKGNMGVEIAIRGRAAHSSLAPLTVNAIDVARPFRHLLRARAQPNGDHRPG
jgi:acetylornithine deacetylase